MSGFVIGLLSFFYVMVCLLLMLIILIQRGDSGGLGSAFGGGGAMGETALGPQGDSTLKRVTSVLAFLFLSLTIFLGYLQTPSSVVGDVAGEGEEESELGIPGENLPEGMPDLDDIQIEDVAPTEGGDAPAGEG